MYAIREVAGNYEGTAANDHADEVLLRGEHFEDALANVEPTLSSSADA
jgi:transitional endoplasmic reticulum ATPase